MTEREPSGDMLPKYNLQGIPMKELKRQIEYARQSGEMLTEWQIELSKELWYRYKVLHILQHDPDWPE